MEKIKNVDCIVYPTSFYKWLIEHGNPDKTIIENIKEWKKSIRLSK